MKVHIVIFAALFSMALIVEAASSGSTSGSTSGSGSGSEKKDKEMEREAKIEFQKNEIQIESKSKDATSKSSLKFNVKSEEGLQLRMIWQANSTSRASLRVRILKLEEFDNAALPTTANGLYSGGAALTTLNLQKTKVDMTQLADTIVAGATVHHFQYKTGPLTIVMHVTDIVVADPATGATFTPGSLKIDVDVANFVYAKPTSRLALLAVVDTASKVTKRSESTESTKGMGKNEGEVDAGSGAFFSFANTAQCPAVNGVAAPVYTVGSSAPSVSKAEDASSGGGEEGENSSRVWFTFQVDSPASICWDPKVGADVSTANTPATVSAASWVSPAWALAAVATILAILF